MDGGQSSLSVPLWLLPKLKLCRSTFPISDALQGLDSSVPECSWEVQPSLISFCKCSKSGFHFSIPGAGFSSFPAEANSTLGWTLRESQFKRGHCAESQLWVICLISAFPVRAGLGSGTDQGAEARLWAAREEAVHSRLCWRAGYRRMHRWRCLKIIWDDDAFPVLFPSCKG